MCWELWLPATTQYHKRQVLHITNLGKDLPGGKEGFPSGSDGKVSACSAGDPGSIPGLGRSPGEGNGNPLTPVLLPGKFHGWSLVRYSPWGNKESDTTERLHFTADKKLGLSQRGGFAPGWISPGGSSEACSPLLKVGVWAEHTWLTLGAENS